MSGPCIDLDMNLLNSPDPLALAASGRGGEADADADADIMEDLRLDHSMMQDASSPDQDLNPYYSRNEEPSENGIEDHQHHDSATTEQFVDNDNPLTTQQQHCVGSQLVESWRDELYMMNEENSILLDDLVKLGADL